MDNLSNRVIDFHDDVNADILKSLKDIPDELRDQEVLSKESCEKFALEVMEKNGSVVNKFPLDNGVMTWLSSKYFEKNAELLPIVARQKAAQFISDSCERYGIEINEEVEKSASIIDEEFNDNFYEMSKAASDEIKYQDKSIEKTAALNEEHNKFALEYNDFLGNKIQRFPIDSLEGLKVASSWFSENYKTLDPDDRRQMAVSLKSENENSKSVNKYASQDYAKKDSFKLAMELRMQFIETPEDAELFADLLEKKASLTPKVFAKALCEFDKTAGIDRYWDSLVPDPYVSTLDDGKLASYISYNDREFTGDDIKKIADDKLALYLDKGSISELKSNPEEIFNSLPDPEKEAIVSLIG